jgi:competence protein ComFC
MRHCGAGGRRTSLHPLQGNTPPYPGTALRDLLAAVRRRDPDLYLPELPGSGLSLLLRRVRLSFVGHRTGLLTGWLAEGLDDPRLKGLHFDLLIPVPLHSLRKRDREFNQAEIFSKILARRSGIKYCAGIERTRRTGTQTALDRRRRMQNLRDAFRLRKNTDVTDKTVLLVDDIFTTGSTLDACSRVLLQAGAKSVRALTVARA